MRISLYKIRTYVQLDTWSHGTKQSQTKPILPDLPLPPQEKASLTSLLTRNYATTPRTQKQSQTNPISPPATKKLTNQGPMRHQVLGTKGYHTAVAAEPPCNNAGCDLLEGSATIRTSSRSSTTPPPRLCRLNNRREELTVRVKNPPTILTCNRRGRKPLLGLTCRKMRLNCAVLSLEGEWLIHNPKLRCLSLGGYCGI